MWQGRLEGSEFASGVAGLVSLLHERSARGLAFPMSRTDDAQYVLSRWSISGPMTTTLR